MTADAKPFGVSLMISAAGFARMAPIRTRQDPSSSGLSRTHAEVSPTTAADDVRRGDVDVVHEVLQPPGDAALNARRPAGSQRVFEWAIQESNL